ncbi:MAG: thioredoxin family protein [Spirochaetaceae bacterium]
MMTEKIFEQGYTTETYLKNLRNYRAFVRRLTDTARASDGHVEKLERLRAMHPQPLRATMMSEDWCGDSACNLPVLADFFHRAGIELRILRGSEHPKVRQAYEREGADHIPVVSLWDGSWNELLRWIEAPQAVAEKKDAWKSEHPEFGELYSKQKTDRSAAKEFAALYRRFLEAMADWYRSGLWEETTREIIELLEQRTGTQAGAGADSP